MAFSWIQTLMLVVRDGGINGDDICEGSGDDKNNAALKTTHPERSCIDNEDDLSLLRRRRTCQKYMKRGASVLSMTLLLCILWRKIGKRDTKKGNMLKFDRAALGWRKVISMMFGAIFLKVSGTTNGDSHRKAKLTPLSTLLHAARNGQVQHALLNGYACVFKILERSATTSSPYATGDSISGQWLKAIIPTNSPTIQSEILSCLSKGGCSSISALPESLSSRFATPAVAAFPFIYLFFMYKMLKRLQGDQDTLFISGSKDNRNNNGLSGSFSTRFADVAGLDSAKAELEEVVQFLRDPSLYTALGARLPRGILLHGPSGAGKTLLARAVAGEAGVGCFLSCSASDFVEMLVGRGASRIRELFDRARKEAKRHARIVARRQRLLKQRTSESQNLVHNTNSLVKNLKPPAAAIIFIDEIDALAKSRLGGLGGCDEREQTLNQLLTEMDGFESRVDAENDEPVAVFVLAATNRPEILDRALLRPGRFDRHVYVGYADEKGKEAILYLHCEKLNLDRASIDLRAVARNPDTADFSGADLANVANEAAFLAARERSVVVQQHHLLDAVQRVWQMKVHQSEGRFTTKKSFSFH